MLIDIALRDSGDSDGEVRQKDSRLAGDPLRSTMLFIVEFEDNLDRQSVRQQRMADHLAFLRRSEASIRAAGPLRQAPEGLALGALWIVEAENMEAIDALVRDDPFWQGGLRKSMSVRHWTKVHPESSAQIG